ncbi:hypothetical protein [Roseibacillus ishigakijimensis]|uniref:Uncharacterized protein n=1 Tax=Roseibacillus ishigakijimensis TaxID=454146 RepID=A0A934VK18_9BACT|nr:hypothetical protein [Roseibacillus ishigakijimensis]MBK1833194.1 hypothetical protein [Roseibacillus ishigakijimensis]
MKTLLCRYTAATLMWSVQLGFSQTEEPDLPYSSGSTGADGAFAPPASMPNRYNFAFAYDSAREEAVVFGGYDRGQSVSWLSGTIRNSGYKPETYTFDGTEWTLRQTDTFVSARYEVEMAYDPERQQCVMFGGLRADGTTLDDTWTWDGNDWNKEEPATTPPARHHHQMIWDSSNNRVLLFGGRSDSGWLSDIWTWDGTNWSQIATTNTPGSSASQQSYGQVVWDSTQNRAVYYNEYYRETYSFDGQAWTEIETANSPNTGIGGRMAYDPLNEEIVWQGGTSSGQTWVFKNNEWSQKNPQNPDHDREYAGMVWDNGNERVLLFGGDTGSGDFQNTSAWDGTNWTQLTGRVYRFDMSAKPDGIWNFTSINIPEWVAVYFDRNAANSPVTWLATEKVTINGRIYLNGETGPDNDLSGRVALGGPGGYDGGLGGVRFDISGRYAGTPGQGPGGGEAPTEERQTGGHGQYTGVYGNTLVQPLIGGSGGGGGSASSNANGGNGGGGGGAILIASSRDIEINGGIQANGGNRSYGGASYGGYGAGGAIRLIADRLIGTGHLEAEGPSSGGEGRIRMEGYYRPLAPNASPVPSATAPVESIDFSNQPALSVISVAGENVAQPPSGSLSSPDVIFTEAGPVSITVQGQNIPQGTPVSVRITSNEGIIELPSGDDPVVSLNASGTATFNTVVPKGTGTIQAFAEFTLTP